MSPLFRKGPRGKAFIRFPDAFHCHLHHQIAYGRDKVKIVSRS